MDASDSLNLATGLVQLALAGVVVRFFGRFGRTYPWLLALAAFFALRGASRIYSGITSDEPHGFGLVLDGAVLIMLVLLLAGLDSTVRSLQTAESSAKARETEYDRALRDYRTLARHRIANPLSVIAGGIETLSRHELREDQEAELLRTMRDEARRLQTLTLDPRLQSEEELGLRPQPSLEENE